MPPIPPAHSIRESVLALHAIISSLSGEDALEALRAGNPCGLVDVSLFGPAWEGARNFRHHVLLSLARHTREEWRRDIQDITARLAAEHRPEAIARALDDRLRITLAVAFQFLAAPHICLLGDALTLAFEAEMRPSEFARELASSGARVVRHLGARQSALDALIMGASGMHRFQPERVLAATGSRGSASGTGGSRGGAVGGTNAFGF